MSRRTSFRSLSILVILALCVTLLCFAFASAAVANGEEPLDIDALLDAYAEEQAPIYVSLTLKTSSDNISLSQGFELQNCPDPRRNYLVFDGTVCIGYLSTGYINGAPSSNYSPMDIPEVTDAYRNNTRFAFTGINEALCLAFEHGEIVLLEGIERPCAVPLSDITYSSLTLHSITVPPLGNTFSDS